MHKHWNNTDMIRLDLTPPPSTACLSRARIMGMEWQLCGIYILKEWIIDIDNVISFDRTHRRMYSQIWKDVHSTSHRLTRLNIEFSNLIANGNITCVKWFLNRLLKGFQDKEQDTNCKTKTQIKIRNLLKRIHDTLWKKSMILSCSQSLQDAC